MHFLFLIISIFSFLIPGKPTQNAHVFLEKGNRNSIIAFQQTGSMGKASFHFLDNGNYQLSVKFPQQEGKWIKERPRHQTLTKATFNANLKTYYYQGEEGFFSIKIQGLKKVNTETFNAIYQEKEMEYGMRITIIQFQAKKTGAQISVFVKSLTASQFKRYTGKTESDISTISIRGTK